MTSNAVAVSNDGTIDISVVEKVITGGDLGQLSPEQRVRYYIETCNDLGLNWRTKPFDVVALRGSGAKTLYPNKGCAEQLAGIHNINVDLLEATIENGVRIQKAKACLANGRCTTSTGAVTVEGLKGDNYANAVMKAETKARRRAILALVGLNMPDASEMETIPGSVTFNVDVETGEIRDAPGERQNAPQRTEPQPKAPTPIAEGNKASPTQLTRINDLFAELEYSPENMKGTIAQLVGHTSAARMTKAQAQRVIDALETEKDLKADGIEVEVIDADDIDWDAGKPEQYTDAQWAELMDPGAAKGGGHWVDPQ